MLSYGLEGRRPFCFRLPAAGRNRRRREEHTLSVRRLGRSFSQGINFINERGLPAVIAQLKSLIALFLAKLGVPTVSEFDLEFGKFSRRRIRESNFRVIPRTRD